MKKIFFVVPAILVTAIGYQVIKHPEVTEQTALIETTEGTIERTQPLENNEMLAGVFTRSESTSSITATRITTASVTTNENDTDSNLIAASQQSELKGIVNSEPGEVTDHEIVLGTAMPMTESRMPSEPVSNTQSLSGISKQWGNALGRTSATLAYVSNATTAEQALPELQNSRDQFVELSASYSSLPPVAKIALKGILKKRLVELRAQADSAYMQHNAAAVLIPVVSPLLQSLNAVTD